jgi:nuclear distribution protein NudE
MSPSFIPQPSRSSLRSLTPTFGAMLMASNSTPGTSRPSSRSAHRVLGKGLPPASKAFPSPQPMAMSVSTSVSTPSSALKRSSRRSSLGVAEAALPPTGIPAPSGRTPGKDRPISVPVFVNGTPPPVPRIPSAHLRASVSLQQKDRLGRDRDSRAGL